MHVGYTQRRREPEGIEAALGATFVPSIDELCASSDAITIYCPLTPETHHLFDAERLARMRPFAILVNTARADRALPRPGAPSPRLPHSPPPGA
jgi:glyoxylate reductase